MNETVRILWSGLTGRTGQAAMAQAPIVNGAEIVVGLKRKMSGADDANLGSGVTWMSHENGMDGLFGLINTIKLTGVNLIVDFSHPDVFERVVELAVRTHVPLISGTSGLSNRQMAMLYDATNQIPIFRGGNFRFKVKNFIDEAVEFARKHDGDLALYENFYEGKELPSETSKVVRKRILEATGKNVHVYSSANLPKKELPCDWQMGVERRKLVDCPRCHTVGFGELAHDVLEIAKVMVNKPIKKGEFYDLDEIWDEIPDFAKNAI